MSGLYKQTVPVIIKYLRNLDAILVKGEKFADEKGMSHDEMISFRLVPDMRGLAYQVQSCSNTAKWLLVRVGRLENVVMADDETTFAQLHDRIDRTIKVLEAADPACLDGKEDAEVIMETKFGNFRFTGQSYVSEFMLPNFHFHLSTAYCILRHLGAPLDAMDYIKDVLHKVE